MAARNAASVLPEPVGAEINVWRRALIAGQASAWAGVGAMNRSANHAATAGWNNFSTFVFGPDATDRGPATRCRIDPAPVCFSKVKSEAEYRKNALRFGYFYKLTRALRPGPIGARCPRQFKFFDGQSAVSRR